MERKKNKENENSKINHNIKVKKRKIPEEEIKKKDSLS